MYCDLVSPCSAARRYHSTPLAASFETSAAVVLVLEANTHHADDEAEDSTADQPHDPNREPQRLLQIGHGILLSDSEAVERPSLGSKLSRKDSDFYPRTFVSGGNHSVVFSLMRTSCTNPGDRRLDRSLAILKVAATETSVRGAAAID